MLQLQICYILLNISQKKLTLISGALSGSDPLQSAGSRALFYFISIMPQISTEDSGILKMQKVTTNTGQHLVSHCVISTLSCSACVQNLQRDLYFIQKICLSIKYVIATQICHKKQTNKYKFQKPNLVLTLSPLNNFP